MSTEISTEISPEIINSLILTGDMSKLTPGQQTQYYNAVCKSVGINPLTQPFAIIVLQGKKTLYATKGCTQQLSDSRKINTEIKKTETIDGVYIASCRATMPDGRFTDDIGAVSIGGIKGSELANAMMKSITKAKRRAVLALCGLGMPDETEVEDMPHSAAQDPTKSRVENIIDTTMEEVKDAPKEQTEALKSTVKEDKPKESKKHAKDNIRPDIGTESLPEGHKTAQGVITIPGKFATVDRDGKATKKWSFTMGEHKYGTFDESVFKGISDIIDLGKETPILINIEYKERASGEKILRDIVKFSQVTDSQIPI